MQNTLYEDKTFENITRSGEEIVNREFEGCCFKNCTLSDTVFNSIVLIECTFIGCNLSMMKLKNCRMNDVSFKGCKILGVNFGECIDSSLEVKFEDCILDYSLFTKKKMWKTQFLNTSLKNADFTETDLTGSKFVKCDLDGAVFANTVCKDVDFVSAANYVIDPEHNNIRKAKFSEHGLAGLLVKYDIRIEY